MWVGMGQLVRDTNPLIVMPVKVFVAFGGKEGDNPAGTQKMVGLIRTVQSNFQAAGYNDSNFRSRSSPMPRTPKVRGKRGCPERCNSCSAISERNASGPALKRHLGLWLRRRHDAAAHAARGPTQPTRQTLGVRAARGRFTAAAHCYEFGFLVQRRRVGIVRHPAEVGVAGLDRLA